MERILIFSDREKANLATAIKSNLRLDFKDAQIIIIDDMDLHAQPLWDFVATVSPLKLNRERRDATREEKRINKNVDELNDNPCDFIEGEESYEKMKEYFLKYTPSFIITIGHGAFKEAVATRKKLNATTNVVQYVADYTLNKQLVSKDLDGYVVENMPLKKQLIALGINAEKILVSQIPIEDKYFDETALKGNVRVNLVESKYTLLFKADDENIDTKDIFNVLKNYQDKYNILVYCGYNHENYKKALKLGLNAFNEGVSLPMLFDKSQIVLTGGNFYDIAVTRAMGKIACVLETQLEMEKRNAKYLSTVVVDCLSNAKLSAFLERYNAKEYYSLSLRSKVVLKPSLGLLLKRFIV